MNVPQPRLDETDIEIVSALARDGRISNAALARQLGIAESTCIHRMRLLRESGVIAGIHARVDLSKVGRPIRAVIHVRMNNNNQREIAAFRKHVAKVPGLIAAFYVAGADDFLLYVAVRDPDDLRDIVGGEISSHAAVSHTETQLVFEVIRGERTYEFGMP